MTMQLVISTLLPLVCAWACMLCVFCGMGLLVLNVRRRTAGLDSAQLALAPWLGWAAALAVLQVWHLLLPVRGEALTLLCLLSATGYVLNRRALAAFVVARGGVLALAAAGSIPVMLWVASHCANQPGVYDCGLYHLSAIRWVCEYPAVPGLALLHGRLGFNNSSALYAALLDQGLFSHRSHQLAGGFLVLLLFARSALAAVRWGRARTPAIHEIFYALAAVPVAIWVVNAGEVSSPTPDTMVFLLGFVVAGELLRVMIARAGSEGEDGRDPKDALQLALLAAAGTACKMNFAVPAAVAVVLAARTVFRRIPERKRRLRVGVSLAGVAALVLIPWAVRGVILSGYPAYPMAVGGVPVSWKVAPESAKCEAEWIKAWAREPGRPKEEVLGSWSWVGRWFARETRIHKADVVMPVALGAFAVVLALRRRRMAEAGSMAAFLLLPVSAIVFVLATAPNPRFAGAAFWIFGLACLSWFLASLPRPVGWRVGVIWAALMLAREITAVEALGPWQRDAGPARTAPVKTMVTESGVKVFVPETGDQCWDAPLPCTPYFSPSLRLRNPANLAQGFTREHEGALPGPP